MRIEKAIAGGALARYPRGNTLDSAEAVMEKVVLQFKDYDTTMDLVRDKASSEGISPEQLIHRAIDSYLGSWGLKDVPQGAAPQSLRELFEITGVMKQPQK